MIKNYFKFAWRNLMKDRQFTTLNQQGLSTGLACTLLIYIWVSDERQMDKFHANDARLFQVLENRVQASGIWTATSSAVPVAGTLANDIPEVEYACILDQSSGTLSVNNEKNLRTDGLTAGPDFFKMFSYRLTDGTTDNVLRDPKSIAVSDDLARKLFGTASHVLGRTVELDHNRQYSISGVFEKPGPQSTQQFDFVLSALGWDRFLEGQNDWGNTGNYSFVMLKPGASAAAVNARIADLIKRKTNNDITYRTPFLKRFSELYLYGHYQDGKQSGGRIDYGHMFSIVAVFILVIACINFMNLSTAKASGRAKEVGIKKAVGAERGTLIAQFLGESIAMAFAALALAIVLVFLFLPAFNGITGKQLSINHPSASLVFTILGIALFAGLLAGSYPALYLSGFRAARVLKGIVRGSATELLVRKGLVVFQFTLSVVLIVAVIVVYRQIRLIQTRNLGYDRSQVIYISKDGKLNDVGTAETFLTEARKIPGVVNAGSIGTSLTGHNSGTYGVEWPGKDPKDRTEFENVALDYDGLKTLGFNMKEGRPFSHSYPADTSSLLINEAGIAYMGLKHPVGQEVTLWGQKMVIVGVVKDFHFQSLHERVKPLFFRLSPENAWRIVVKTGPGTTAAVVAKLQGLYQKMNPGYAFDYRFLDEDYQQLYASENRVAVLSKYFAGLTILISCLGLFGLAAFTAQRRSKEIGIRKVLGASVANVVVLLSGDFLKLIALSLVIAFPLAWWAGTQWLKGFVFRTPIGAGIFVTAAISILLITLITISFQSVRAALTNPVKSLKTD